MGSAEHSLASLQPAGGPCILLMSVVCVQHTALESDWQKVTMPNLVGSAGDHPLVPVVFSISTVQKCNESPTNRGNGPGIRYRIGAYPFEDPGESEGFGFVFHRYINPRMEEDLWVDLMGISSNWRLSNVTTSWSSCRSIGRKVVLHQSATSRAIEYAVATPPALAA
jgi:hypothetical protein